MKTLDISREIEPFSIHKLVISGDFDTIDEVSNCINELANDNLDLVFDPDFRAVQLTISVECWTEFAFELLEETVLELVEKFSGEICVEWQ